MPQSQSQGEDTGRASLERYKSIFDNAVFGMLVSTPDGRFLEVNAALVAMLGYESQEALIEAGPQALYPAASARSRLVDNALGGHATAQRQECDWVRADGSMITVRLNGKMFQMADGERGFEVIVQDITREKRQDKELQQTQKMGALGKLAGGVAHDFNNLLTVIAGNADFIADGLSPDHPIHAELDQIMKATERATSLAAQLLAFSREGPWTVRRIDLNEVLTNMEKMLGHLIGEDVTLETRHATDLPPILIDRSELEQIVMNLVLNARDAMPTGGRMVIETRSVPIDESVEYSATTDGILLSVRDGGLGMDSETREHIFEPFYTTKPVGKGTGLGLSLVYGIVQRAEGYIDVESEPGQGTTINVWFPRASDRAEPEQHAERRTPGPAKPVLGGARVLVVEDEELVRDVVQRVLAGVGYEVLAACDGQEALEIVEGLDAPVDLVLTDVMMPRMTGPELVNRLATISPETAVLFMTGYVDARFVSEQLADGADSILRKPFNAGELRDRVRLLLERRDTLE